MQCPDCGASIPAEKVYEDLTAKATKLGPADLLVRTPRGMLLRLRVKYARQDLESGMDSFKVIAAMAADETGDVAIGMKGEHVIYPGLSVSIRSTALQRDASGRALVSFTGELAQALQGAIEQAEAMAFSTQHLVSRFGAPETVVVASNPDAAKEV